MIRPSIDSVLSSFRFEGSRLMRANGRPVTLSYLNRTKKVAIMRAHERESRKDFLKRVYGPESSGGGF